MIKMVLLGAPGAGKGSQASVLSKEYNLPHISTGDAFRANISKGTEIGKLAQTYVEKGLLVPDEIVIGIVKQRLSEDDCANGYILDGFPRTINQAIELDKIENLNLVINIMVSNEVVIERISGRRACQCGQIYHVSTYPHTDCEKCGGKLFIRTDDQEETVLNRLKVYEKQTAPLINYYKEKGILYDVDGSISIQQTFTLIQEIINHMNLHKDDNN